MRSILSATIYQKDDGDFYVTYWTGPHASTLGVLVARSSWTVGADRGDDGAEDVPMGVALATSALGSRLLRLAESISQQPGLFDVDVQGGPR